MRDRASLYAMAAKIWGAGAGVVTVALVGTVFSPPLQGYFFTFGSLLTLQTFVELGFAGVVQQLVSHEWAHVEASDAGHRDRARGRLAAIARLAGRFYAALAVALVLLLGAGGSWYFHRFADAAETPANLTMLWWLACAATGLMLLLVPYLAILEGANRVERVYGVRLRQNVLGRLASWIVIVAGAGLWAIPIARITTALTGAFGLGREGLSFFRELGRWPASPNLSWRREVWPLQWRFAVSWIGGYLVFSLFTPVLFAVGGAELAGRMGMTIAVATTVSGAAHALVATRVPRLAILAARREFETMDEVFRKAARSSLALVTLGASAVLGGLLVLDALELPLAKRFLPPADTALLFAAIALQQVRFALGSYLRAHKQEPLALLSLGEGVAALCVLTPLGKIYGATGMLTGFVGLSVAFLLPAVGIFGRCRARWHTPPLATHVQEA